MPSVGCLDSLWMARLLDTAGMLWKLQVVQNLCNYPGAQAIGNGLPAKTAARAASIVWPCLRIVDR